MASTRTLLAREHTPTRPLPTGCTCSPSKYTALHANMYVWPGLQHHAMCDSGALHISQSSAPAAAHAPPHLRAAQLANKAAARSCATISTLQSTCSAAASMPLDARWSLAHQLQLVHRHTATAASQQAIEAAACTQHYRSAHGLHGQEIDLRYIA